MWYNIIGDIMKKDNFLSIRINSEKKEKVERILKDFDLRISEAVNMFLNQVIIEKGIPFSIKQPKYDEKYHELEKAITYNSFGGGTPSLYAKKILRLYATDLIDYETALYAIEREGL